MKKLSIFCLWLLLPCWLSSQSLIANGDFEENNICTEYNSACAPEAWFRIPPTDLHISFFSRIKPPSGKFSEVLVLENIYHPVSLRVFLYTKLLCPLIEGQEYVLSFYAKPLHVETFQIGVLFNDRELISRTDNPIGVEPSLLVNENDFVEIDTVSNWRKYQLSYTATGNEQFVTFGNFSSKPTPNRQAKDRANVKGDIISLIDKVSLRPKITVGYPLCNDYEDNIVMLYDTDERHTYNKSIDKVNQKPPTPEEVVTEEPEVRKEITFEIPDIAFDFDKHNIRADYRPTLDSLVQTISKIEPQQISVIGHTDSRGSEDYNIILSEKRALSIKVFLLKKLPDYKNEIHAEGRGESQPKATNTTPLGRAKNRRVEIVVQVGK